MRFGNSRGHLGAAFARRNCREKSIELTKSKARPPYEAL
jgi:hypothetical protein